MTKHAPPPDGGGIIIIHGVKPNGDDQAESPLSPTQAQAAIDAMASAAMSNTAVAAVRNALIAAKAFATG